MLLTLRMQRRAEKAFTKWPPGMFPTRVQSLAELYSCTWGLFWRKFSLNDCTVLYFAEIKRFREHFEATTYMRWCGLQWRYLNTIFREIRPRVGWKTERHTRTHTRIVISLDYFYWLWKGSRCTDSCLLPRIGLFARRHSTVFLFRRVRKIAKSDYWLRFLLSVHPYVWSN